MFALKNLGWNEKADTEKALNGVTKKLTIAVIDTGHKPVSNENEVILD